MKRVTFIIAIATLFLTTSCVVTRTNESKSFGITGPGIFQNPVIADLDVSSKKVTGNASGSTSSNTLELIKSDALANALAQSNSDVLVEPIFTTKTASGVYNVQVTGFPAVYKNFRSITKEDIEILEAGKKVKQLNFQRAQTHQAVNVEKSKKGKGALAATLGVLGGGSAVFFLLFLL